MVDNYTKKQHHIPRFLLENFADKNGYVWVLDKQTEKIFPAKPENIACKNHLYSVDYGTHKDDWLEKQFAIIEGRASPILAEMHKNKDWPEEDQKAILIVEFLCILMQRDPAVCEKDICTVKSVTEFFCKNMSKIPIREFIELKDKISRLFKGEALRYSFFPASNIFCEIINNNFLKGFYSGKRNDVIISDKYCNTIDVSNIPEKEKQSFIQLLKYRLMITCPISQRDIIIFINKSQSREWADNFLEFIGKELFDAMTLAQASRFVYGAEEAHLQSALESFHKHEKGNMCIPL